MSSRYQERFRVGELVYDKHGGRVGTVRVVDDIPTKGKQLVVLQTSEGAKGMVAMEVPRTRRGDTSAPLRRLGTPPSLQPGDVVIAQGQRFRVDCALPHGSVRARSEYGHVYEFAWPKWRKAKKDKGGLGKFSKGDLVTYGDSSVVYRILGLSYPLGKGGERRRLECENVAAIGRGGVFYFYSDNFAKMRRSAPFPVDLSALYPAPPLPKYISAPLISKEPMSHAGVGHLENTLELVKRFHLEKDGHQAALLADTLLESLNRLSPVCAIRGSFDIVFDRAVAEPIQKVNAHA